MGVFKIELSSGHADWPRFKVTLMCEMQDDTGRRTGMASSAEKSKGVCCVETGDCTRVRTFVYAIPESLPAERRVERMPDFPAKLRVECDGHTVSEELLAINHWGGTSIERLFSRDGILEPREWRTVKP